MQVSAGLALIDHTQARARILLCHPTSSPWNGTYTIPKGLVEPGEALIDAALRETLEETGIVVPRELVQDGGVVDYIDRKGRLFKQLHWFRADVAELEIPDIVPRSQLQLAEVDWAGLLDRETAERKIFHRFKPLLELLG